MGRKVKINNGIDITNAKQISIGGVEITFEHIDALFLSRRCEYSVVNTPSGTKVIFTSPTYSDTDKHMVKDIHRKITSGFDFPHSLDGVSIYKEGD